MDEMIVDFIARQRVISLCCIDEENKPYCFSCFYAFDREKQLFYFKSGSNTRHSSLLLSNPAVAGTIQPDRLNPLAIKGIQLTGCVLPSDDGRTAHAETAYYRRFPFALAMPGNVWTLQPESIKMTDSTLGFGKKIHWKLGELVH